MLDSVQGHYDIQFESICNSRDFNIITSSVGEKYILKKVRMQPKRVIFVHEIKEYLYKNDFMNTDRYILTKENTPCFTYRENVFVLSKNIDGEICCFENHNHVKETSGLLASMHKASKGFKPSVDCIPREELGIIPLNFKKRLEELKKLKKTANKGKSKFDFMFIQNCDFFIDLAEDALYELKDSKYEDIVSAAKKTGCICHHDFTHHNIIFTCRGAYLKNFEYSSIEIKEYDIANFIRRKMRRCNWDAYEAEKILLQYTKILDISSEEFEVLGIILKFPQKFWRIVNRYYNSKKTAFEKNYIQSLDEVIQEAKYHNKFLVDFNAF